MAITTYSELKSTIQQVIEDDSAEVSAWIPEAIYLAEERLSKDLDMQTQTKVTTTSAVTNVSIPGGGIESRVSTGIKDSDFLYVDNIYQCGQQLDHVDYSYTKEINRYETSAAANGRYWAMKTTASTVYIAPPVSNVVIEINFVKTPTRLASNVQSNEILAKAPDLLYYATMIEMSMFLKNWDTLEHWKRMYQESLASMVNTTRRERTEIGQKHTGSGETQSTTGIQ